MKLSMTSEEIVRDYKTAKNPKKQVGILADLNGTSVSTIVEILKAAGIDGRKLPRIKRKPVEEPAETTTVEVVEETSTEPVEEVTNLGVENIAHTEEQTVCEISEPAGSVPTSIVEALEAEEKRLRVEHDELAAQVSVLEAKLVSVTEKLGAVANAMDNLAIVYSV